MPGDEIPPIEDNGKIHYTPLEKASLFNQYFTSQSFVTNENDDIPFTKVIPDIISPLTVSTEMVRNILKALDGRKAVGPDLVHNKLLNASSDIISEPLAKLFNRSLTEGKFPSIWKLAHVTPLFKKGDRHNCENYRPISLLSCIGKVLETCVQQHVLTFLMNNNLLSAAQSGFIPNDSTVFQLLSIYDDFCKFIDSKTTAQAIFFDVSKAFDKVWHRALIHKLFAIGIRGNLLNWFTDYLKDRRQAVVLKGSRSPYLSLSAGVPQGSVLGPLLFLVYINDIAEDIESIIKLFADDTSMYLGLENVNVRTEILNSDLDKISSWAMKWKVKFNQSKTDLMTITNKILPETQPLTFDTVNIQESYSHKHLGVILQSNCKWDVHIKSVISKCRTLVACLRSFKHRLSRKALAVMYKSFILPHMDYADIVWDNCTNKSAEDLENLHLDAIRTIVGAVRGTSHQKLYTESGFTSLQERRRRHKIILYYKIVNGLVPNYLVDRLPHLVSSVNPYHRRKPLERTVPHCRTQLYNSSFFPSTTALWNELPDYAKKSNSLSFFKRFLRSSDSIVPDYYHLPDRSSEVHLCKLRLEISDLNHDLFRRHIKDNFSCDCGNALEDVAHFLLNCPLHHQARAQTIDLLTDEVKTNVPVLLFGNHEMSVNENRYTLLAVGKFIHLSRRFTRDYQV